MFFFLTGPSLVCQDLKYFQIENKLSVSIKVCGVYRMSHPSFCPRTAVQPEGKTTIEFHALESAPSDQPFLHHREARASSCTPVLLVMSSRSSASLSAAGFCSSAWIPDGLYGFISAFCESQLSSVFLPLPLFKDRVS